MIETVKKEETTFTEAPLKFEAGTHRLLKPLDYIRQLNTLIKLDLIPLRIMNQI